MQKSSIKIVFFGSFGFAVPTLETLVSAGYEVVTVVTNPDKPSGRNKILTPPPVKIRAQGLGFRVLQPINLKDPKFVNDLYPTPYTLPPDIGIVVGYGKIIPPEIFNLPEHGTLAIHPSLLPKYRGPSPVQTAMLNGDTETGVTIIKLDAETDHGDILATAGYKLAPDSLYEKAHSALFNLGADLLIKTLPDYLAGKIKLQPQDHSKVTFTHKFTTADGEIKTSDTAEQAYNKIRALNPEPGTFLMLPGNKKLKILEAELPKHIEPLPERFLQIIKERLVLPLSDGYIILKTVQPEGKKLMSGENFARGYFK